MFGFLKKKKKTIQLDYKTSARGLTVEASLDGEPLSFLLPPFKLKGIDTESDSFERFQAMRQFLSFVTAEQMEEVGLCTERGESAVVFQWDQLIEAHSTAVTTEESDSGKEDLESVLSALAEELFAKAKPVTLSLENHGTFRDPDFRVDPQFFDENGNRLHIEDGAGGINSRGQLYLLGKKQFDLSRTVREPWPSGHQEKHLHWAEIQKQTLQSDIRSSAFLESEKAAYIENVKPTVSSPEPGVLELGVEFEHDRSKQLSETIEKQGQIGPVYSFAKGRDRERVFFSNPVRAAIQGIRKHRRLTGAEAARFVQDPESLLPFDCIDLSDFSDRVAEVGFHVYRPVETVGGAGGVGDYLWTEERGHNAKVELRFNSLSPDEEPLVLDLTDPEVETELRKQVRAAFANGEDFVEVRPGHHVPIYAFPSSFLTPLTSQEDEEKLSKNLTVQPKTNLEVLEFGKSGEVFTEDQDRLSLPDSLAPGIELHSYQHVGYQKIGKVALGKVSHASGFLLADDMGLGKTLQVLAVLARLIEDGRQGPHLIVAKPVLLENWTREMHKFFPGLFRTPLIVQKQVTLGEFKQAQVVLSSYDQLRRRQLDLARVNWDSVILDEAQKIKDPATQTTRASWALPAKTRLAMTGTPIENSLTDLWSISNFFQPGLLDSLSRFRERHQDSEGDVVNLSQLRKTLEPLFLRRTKAEVATDLPPITEVRFELEIQGRQLELYEREMQARRDQTRKALETVNRLLQLCTHASLIDYSELWPCQPDQCPKLFKTFEILDSIKAAGEKVLIFTKFLKAQSTLKLAIDERYNLHTPIINGSTKERQSVIDRFGEQHGFAVLILSPEAAGVGLNITAANHVIHFTRSWNPAIERQATDRAYRLGQEKPVTVYFPIVVHPERGTIEQRLDELLKRKTELFWDIFVPASQRQISAKELLE